MTTIPAAEFDGPDFWRFLQEKVMLLGVELVRRAMLAYYVATDPKTPAWAQAALFGALVYLGMPLDAVPDYIPVAGFSDDAAVLLAALAAVAVCVRPRHLRRVDRKLRKWCLGGSDES